MIMEAALAIVKAGSGLNLGEGDGLDARYCRQEIAAGAWRQVGVGESVGRLLLMVRIGGADCVDRGAPQKLASSDGFVAAS